MISEDKLEQIKFILESLSIIAVQIEPDDEFTKMLIDGEFQEQIDPWLESEFVFDTNTIIERYKTIATFDIYRILVNVEFECLLDAIQEDPIVMTIQNLIRYNVFITTILPVYTQEDCGEASLLSEHYAVEEIYNHITVEGSKYTVQLPLMLIMTRVLTEDGEIPRGVVCIPTACRYNSFKKFEEVIEEVILRVLADNPYQYTAHSSLLTP